MDKFNSLDYVIINNITSLTEQATTAHEQGAWITCIALAILAKLVAFVSIPITLIATPIYSIYHLCTGDLDGAGAAFTHGLNAILYPLAGIPLQVVNEELRTQIDELQQSLEEAYVLNAEILASRQGGDIQQDMERDEVVVQSTLASSALDQRILEDRVRRAEQNMAYDHSVAMDKARDANRLLTTRIGALAEENQQLQQENLRLTQQLASFLYDQKHQVGSSSQASSSADVPVATTDLSAVYTQDFLRRMNQIKQDFKCNETSTMQAGDYARFNTLVKREQSNAPVERTWNEEEQKIVGFIEQFVQDMEQAQQGQTLVLHRTHYTAFLEDKKS